jgi:integrase/recombinase XerC
MTHTFAAAPARRRTLPRALRAPPSKMPLSSRFSEKVQITAVTHLTEDGVDRRFIQSQVGHECDSSTAIYTHVSDDYMNTALRQALSPAFAPSTPSLGRPSLVNRSIAGAADFA